MTNAGLTLNLNTLGAETAAEFGSHLSMGVDQRLHLLVSEIGELAKEVLKATGYGTREFQATAAFRDELGDVTVDLALLAHAASVDLAGCAALTLAKMRARLAERGHVGSETA